MKRKLLTAFLAIVMLMSSVPSAMAAKKISQEELAKERNIYKWGDFENGDENTLQKIGYLYNRGTVASIVEGGANGTEHCLKLDATKNTTREDQHDDILINFPHVGGESYDISFYVRSDSPEVTSVQFIAYYQTSGDSSGYYSTKVGPEWTKLERTFSPTGLNHAGKEIPEMERFGKIMLRFIGAVKYTVYIDELSIVPHGKVTGVDYGRISSGLPGAEEDIKTVPPVEVSEAGFTDISGHWAENVIDELATYEYIDGIGEGQYAPESDLTRAQFIKMVADTYNMAKPRYDGRFSDVRGNEWFTEPLMIADTLGLIDAEMKKDGNIKPDQPITREEAASIAAKVAKKRGAKAKANAVTSFDDENTISEWAKQSVKSAASYGLIKGYDDGTYKPENKITRAEAAQILFRIIEVYSKMQIYVDAQNGDDEGDGSKEYPLKTIEAARDMAAEYAPKMQHDIKVFLRGKFRLDSTLEFKPENSGKNRHYIIYTSWGEEKPILTMADEYTNFELYDENLNIYRTYVGEGVDTRQVYFNDVKGIRARTVGYLNNGVYKGDHWLCDETYLLNLQHPQDAEMVFHINWCHQRLLIRGISETEDGKVRIDPHEEYYKISNIKSRLDFGSSNQRAIPTRLENAYEFLNEKGEYYLNKHDGYLYYIPRTGEDMSTMVAKVPVGEHMMRIQGPDYDTPVTNLKFDNIQFEGTTWMRPTRVGGHCANQNNGLGEKAYRWDYMPDGTIHLEKARYISFTNSLFRQMGTTALTALRGSKHIDIIGNRFYDLSGNAVSIDSPQENGSPFDRSLKSICEYVKVNNNYISNIGTDYKSSCAISFCFPRHAEFNHNEIAYIPYSGFHGSYGWEGYAKTGTILYDVQVSYNYIHDTLVDRLYDGGSIYTVGRSSRECDETNTEKNNKMIGNYLTNAWNGNYIYPDEGSTHWYIKDTVADSSMVKEIEEGLLGDPAKHKTPWFIHMHTSTITWMTTKDNYTTCDYAYRYGWMNMVESNIEPLNIITDGNWPDEAKAIMANAGIEPEYRDNFDDLDYGPKYLICMDKKQAIPLNKPTDSGLRVLGRKHGEIFPISDFEIDWWIDDPEAITIDENGFITCHKNGLYEAEAVVTIDGHTYLQHFRIESGNEITELKLNTDIINIITDSVADYQVLAYNTFGTSSDATDVAESKLVSGNTDIVTVEKVKPDGVNTVWRITAVGEGSTKITGRLSYGGVETNVSIPVNVISYGSDEALELPYREIDLQGGWKNAGVKEGDGYRVTGEPNHFMGNINNELIAFDVMCNPGSSWPSFSLLEEDMMGDYNTNDCYLFGFKSTFIEFQRFVDGKRTLFFGDPIGSVNPLAGPGVPNEPGEKIFEYNKRYSVIVGAIEAETGTRLILTVNGKNIIDYTDTSSTRVSPKKNTRFTIYNPAGTTGNGGFTFWPYSGITDAE